MMWNWNGAGGMWGWDGWAVMGGMMVLFTLIVVGVVAWAVAPATRSSSTRHSFETPRAILDRRLAAGEISEDEYAEARRLIEDGSAAPVG